MRKIHSFIKSCFTQSCLLCILLSCGSNSKQQKMTFWDNCDIVATREIVNGDTVVVCDLSAVKQKLNIPLSLLVEDFEVIKFDNSKEEALISQRVMAPIVFSKNYMALHSFGAFPLKLFKRDGTFLRHIGAIGQGPGEYYMISEVQIDEDNNRIYLSSWISDKILIYDLDGNIYPPIPLPRRVVRCRMRVDSTNKTVLMMGVFFEDTKSHIWIQDFGGRVIQETSSLPYDSDQQPIEDFIITGQHTKSIELFREHYKNSNDLLYHYSIDSNKLIPRFKIINMKNDIVLYELPNQYIVETVHSTGVQNDVISTKIIIDKVSLKGCYFDGFITPSGVLLDQYPMLAYMTNGYFSLVDFGSEIEKRILKVNEKNLSSENREKLDELRKIIEKEEDDCSLLFVGKFKQ